MANKDVAFTGSVPEIYDTYLVPLIFEGYAQDLAQRVAAVKPARVLETAAGTGVVTRALLRQLPPGARYYVTDLNQAMLDRAAKSIKDTRILWQQADALDLPYPDKDFGAVICQFGVMFFPDRLRGYREAKRVLEPGGLFAFNVWDSLDHNEFARLVTEAAATVFPDDPPLFLMRTPHGYHDAARIRADLKDAGFSAIDIETVSMISKAPSPRHPAIAYVQGTPLRGEIEPRRPKALEAVTERAAEMIAKAHGTGAVSGKIRALVVTARA